MLIIYVDNKGYFIDIENDYNPSLMGLSIHNFAFYIKGLSHFLAKVQAVK